MPNGTEQEGALSVLSMVDETDPGAKKRAREILERYQAGTDFGAEEEILKRSRASAEEARATLQSARQRLLGQKFDERGKWLRMAQAFLSPTRTGQFGESVGAAAGAMAESKAAEQEFEQDRARRLMDLQLKLSGVDQGTLQAELGLAKSRRGAEAGLAREALKTLRGGGMQTLEELKLRTQIADIQERLSGRQEKKALTEEKRARGIENVTRGIESTLTEITKAKEEAKEPGTTGIPGEVMKNIPATDAYNLQQRIVTIKANIGFDKLQAMRDASPTGGALGQVAIQELDALQNSIAALNPAMGREKLIENLNKIEEHYKNWKLTMRGVNPQGEETAEEETPMTLEKALEKYGD